MPASGAVLVELKTGANTWTDITTDVRVADGIEITRGKTGESGQAPPAECRLTLNNRAGRYSPRNPLSDLFGKIGRNTQLRVGIQADPTFDAFSSSSGTGDLSFTHTPAGTPTGVLLFLWEVNTTFQSIQSVTYGGVPMTRKLFAGFTLGSLQAVGSTWFLSGGIPAGPQTVLVDTASTLLRHASVQTITGGTNCEYAGETWNFSGATPSSNPGANVVATARAVYFGSLLSDLDDGSTITPRNLFTESGETDIGTETVATSRWPTALNPGAYTVGWNAASAHWGRMAVAVRAVNYRFWGEVSEFPGRYELSGKEARIPIQAAGILRRLGQGDEPSSTGLRSFLEPSAGLFRYWPLSGAAGTTYSLDIAPVWGQQTSGVRFYSEGTLQQFRYGEPLQTSETGSADTETNYLGTGMALLNTTAGPMRADVANGYQQWAVDFVFQAPSFGSFQMLMNDYGGYLWTLYMYGSTDQLQVGFTDPATGPIGFLIINGVAALSDAQPHHLRFQVEPTGVADSKFTVWIDGVQISTGTQSGYRSSGLSLIRFDYGRAGAETWVTLAHLAVFADAAAVVWPTAADVTDAARGYDGELAGDRVVRILGLAGIDLQTVGVLASTAAMGTQYKESMLKQLRDAEAADLGVLAEPRDAAGLLYRTHASLYNQTPALTLAFDGGHVSTPFEPVDDDQATRNDVTAVRRGGDSYRVYQATGPLSIQPPPNGVGRYSDEQTVNVQTDDQLPLIVGWLLHLGTLDAARYPSVPINLAAPDLAPLIGDALAVDVGDRIEITGAAAINVYADLALLVLGYSEFIGAVDHILSFVCSPGELYEVVELDHPDTRLAAGGSTLNSALTSSATSVSVITTGNELWTTSGGELPLQVVAAGEEMTVTAVAGTTPAAAQTFTVTRAVNGVVKAHAAGTPIELKRAAVLAL